ncbi:hypothetical protein B0T20DRAFT_17236 [Sordaria brevicollis]|uniref:Uncharacterized protein n=1 Tax=Sordaria brevicollis TaxID=83679 RepID=A0AAE0PNH2_SORBR|nr:hypothetical protein B0T20DRAFT_17236 [Sordaria brevicollis]
MGGKQWSKQEELVFWKEVVPRSPKRVGVHRQNREHSWKECATWMQRRMGPKESRRTYTELCLFEHYFQNAEKQKFSPHAELLVRKYLRQKKLDEANQGQSNGQLNAQSVSNGNDHGEPQAPEPLNNAGSHGPMTPIRPRNATEKTRNTDRQVDTPWSMVPFAPGYNNSDGYGSIGSPASSPSFPGRAGHLHHSKPKVPLGRTKMSTAPMAPMDEEELPSLASLQADSPLGNVSPSISGQHSEINSSPPIYMPQAMRPQSVIERQAASAGMSVQDLLNSSPAKQEPMPQAYHGPADNGYGFQGGYDYQPNYAQNLGQGYNNGYSQGYTSGYAPSYGQGYNNGYQSNGQVFYSSPGPQNRPGNNGYPNWYQSYESSPGPQGPNNGVQNYNQGYESSPNGAQNRVDNESVAIQAPSNNATRSSHEAEPYNNEYNGYNNANGYNNTNIPNGDEEELPAYSTHGNQQSMTSA